MSALEFNNHFLNQIIYHSIKDDKFIKKIRGRIDKEIFKTREKQFLIDIVFSYYDEYKCAPKDNFYDIFKEHESRIGQDLYERCINLIGVLRDISGSNPEYILNTLHDATKHFRLEEASVEFAKFIKNGKYDEAKTCILKAMQEPEIIRESYDYFTDTTFIEKRIQEKRYKMVSGISHLDRIIGGYNPPWVITLLGSKNSGKSWGLIETALQGVMQGLNVTYISLEMNKEQVDERFDMSIGFMSNGQNKNPETMKKVGEKWIKVKDKLDSIYDIGKVIKNKQRMSRNFGGKLRVFAFNRGRMNWQDIESHLDLLEQRDGYITELLVVDYLGLMRETVQGQNKKERISENCLGLKDTAGRKNLIVATAMQGNRLAMQAKIFKSYMIADDIDTIFHSDLVLAICQTPVEELRNQHRIYIANFRHGIQHRQVGVIRDLTIGQMALDSFELKDEEKGANDEKVIGVDF